MRLFIRLILPVAFSLGLTSCAAWRLPPLQPGQSSEAEVVAKLGNPTHRYRDGNDTLLEYMMGPAGQETRMARIGPDGILRSVEQVLTLEKFATIRVNQATRDDVLKTVGAPSESRYFPSIGLEAWSYPYKEQGVWDSEMSIYLDKQGMVRRIENGPDPRRMSRDNDP